MSRHDAGGPDGCEGPTDADLAVQVHLYPVTNVLNPRGVPLAKESLSDIIYRHLMASWEYWTDPNYGDNPKIDDLRHIMRVNLEKEVRSALNAFLLEKAKES